MKVNTPSPMDPMLKYDSASLKKKLPGTRFQLEQATPLGSKNAISCLEDWLVMASLSHHLCFFYPVV